MTILIISASALLIGVGIGYTVAQMETIMSVGFIPGSIHETPRREYRLIFPDAPFGVWVGTTRRVK